MKLQEMARLPTFLTNVLFRARVYIESEADECVFNSSYLCK